MPSDAQKRADRKYKREKTNQVCLRFYPTDSDMWDYLDAKDNRQGFIKGLIRREMKAHPADAPVLQATESQRAPRDDAEQLGGTRRTRC